MDKTKLICLLKSFRIYILYHIKTKVSKAVRVPPFLVILNPTNRCNLKCKYCQANGAEKASDINPRAIFKLIDDCEKMGVPMLSFSGGEPLLYKDLIPIAKYAHKRKILLNLNTNATLINEKNFQQIATYFDYVRVSLDGVQRTHDRLCRVPGSYAKVSKAINLLSSLRNKNAKICLNFTYDEENAKEFRKVYEKFSNKVDLVQLLPQFNFINKEFRYSIKGTSLPKGFKKIVRSTSMHKRRTLKEIHRNCDAGVLYYSIASNGAIRSCPFSPVDFNNPGVLGDLNRESFYDVIYHKKYKGKVNDVKKILESRGYDEKTAKKLIKDRLIVNDGKIVNICSGCSTTCTTEVSNLFRKNPFREIIKAMRLF